MMIISPSAVLVINRSLSVAKVEDGTQIQKWFAKVRIIKMLRGTSNYYCLQL